MKVIASQLLAPLTDDQYICYIHVEVHSVREPRTNVPMDHKKFLTFQFDHGHLAESEIIVQTPRKKKKFFFVHPLAGCSKENVIYYVVPTLVCLSKFFRCFWEM